MEREKRREERREKRWEEIPSNIVIGPRVILTCRFLARDFRIPRGVEKGEKEKWRGKSGGFSGTYRRSKPRC